MSKPENKVERFLDIGKRSLHPRNKAKILWGIAFSMSLEELREARAKWLAFRNSRIKRLTDLGAPEVILENEVRLRDESITRQALEKALREKSAELLQV